MKYYMCDDGINEKYIIDPYSNKNGKMSPYFTPNLYNSCY